MIDNCLASRAKNSKYSYSDLFNDKRFSANMIQAFFKENHLHQVFTHPYTS
ncbi:MAG: hypothetical protein ACK5H1_08250 [Tenacibaculum sp.]